MIPKHIYTQKGETAEKQVRDDLQTIVSEFQSIADGTYILTGSFGRGEGSVYKADQEFLAINDYDFVIIPDNNREGLEVEFASVADNLAAELSVDFVDVMVLSRSDLSSLSPSIFNYDLRYGSVIVHGDENVLAQVPNFEPGEIPTYESVVLLSNRIGGLLGGIVNGKSDCYLQNQIQKLRLAWADSLLLTQSQYCASYREKARLCLSLLENGSFEGINNREAVREGITESIEFKFDPSYDRQLTDRDLQQTVRTTHDVFSVVIETLLDASFVDPWEAYRALIRHRFEPHIRVRNVFRLWRAGVFGLTTALRVLPDASENQIRVSIIFVLHRVVLDEYPVPPPRFINRIADESDLPMRKIGKDIYNVWDTLYH